MAPNVEDLTPKTKLQSYCKHDCTAKLSGCSEQKQDEAGHRSNRRVLEEALQTKLRDR